MKSKENIYNIPNALSFYRLLTFPFLIYLIYSQKESLFTILIAINLITDILDGLIARIFKLQTAFGAKLDSLADNGTYIAAFIGIYIFKYEVMAPDIWMLWLFIGGYLSYLLFSFLKFKIFPSLHLYSTKIGGYVQGIFLFVLFVWGYNPYLFYLAMGVGYYSQIEELIILYRLPKMKSNVKGLYWVLKEEKNPN